MKIAGNNKKSKNLDTVERSTLEEKKNNNFSSKFLNKKSGITMVALVVTIVVLLILASISIQGITRTGIFRAAEDTKLEHKRASIATTLQTKLKINQTEQIRGTDEEIVKATYEDVKNDLEEIKKAGGKDIEVSEVTSEEKDGKTEWFFEVKVDGDVYKVGLDGSDYLGKEDELAPLIEIKKATATTNAITATVTTRRNEGGKIEYYIKEKGSQKFDLAGTTDQNTFKYTKLKQETTYVIEAVAINTNGKKKVSKEYEIKTSLVPKIDSNEIKFASVPNEWTNKSVEVTATLTVDGQNFTLTTSKNPTSGWIASNRQIFTENGTMYAALTDGNNYGIAASHEVTNIDTTKPIVKSLSVTTNTIKITATDEASGIYSYAISESEKMPKTFTKLDNSTQVFNTVVENLKQSTKYYVWVKDVAGNISEVASTKTGTVPKLTDANTTITKSPNDWTKQEVIATASTTEKNYTLQTKKDNGEWQTTNTQKFTENGTIYARLWDGTNAGEEIYKPITNIDKTAPTATNIEIKNVTPAGYDVYVYGVKDNGSGVNRVQFPTWTEAKGQDDIQPNWQTGASSKGTKQADGTTWVYHVNITDHKTEAGEYNTHIYAYDNLENVKCIGTKKITVPMVKITYNENYVKDGTTNKQTVEKIYNTELGTLRTPTRTGYTFAGWFTEATGGTQISSTTKTPVTDTTYYAHWNANPLNFENQTISKTFSTSEQKADITGASNGTGNYTYTEKTEKNSAQKDTNYISINGTTITIAANTPADTYTYVIVATDNNSKVTKEATYTIKIERAKTANAGASDKTYNGTNQTGATGTSVTWTGTTSAIDAGTYTANATPDANHAWSDGTTNAKAITWKMNPKSIAVTWGTTTTFTYNGQPQAPTVSATSGITGETINVTRTTGTNAGTYTSTASISSVSGGRANKANYTLSGNTKAFTINPSSTAIKVYYPTSATAVSLKTVYRNKCSSSSTVLSTTNTGTSNNVLASTYNGLYGSFGGYATAVNTTTRATTAIAGIATRAETTYYVVTTGSNTSSITATFNYYNGSAWTSTTKAGTRTNNYAYYCTSTTAAKTATAYSHGSIAAPSTSAGPYSTAYVGWSTGSKSMSTTSVTTANTTYYAVYRSNVAVKVVTGTAAANVTSKTIYRNAMKDGTFLSESNTGTSNLTTISGAYNYAGLATSTGTTTCATITTCAASTTRTFYTVGKTISNSTITVTYKYQNGSNDKTASGTKTVIKKYYVNSSNQVTSNSSTTNPQFTMPTATKTGCNFAGWNTSNTATTATYTAGQKVSIGSSTTLYGIWIINGSVGLSATSGSTCTGKETTFTVNSNPSGGKLSVSSANTGIATTSISGTTVTVTPKAIGSTTITVTSAANKNYTSASKTYTITVGNHNATTGGTLKSAATCTAAAVYYHKCSICGKGLSSTYSSGSALGHNYTSTKRMGSWSWTENTGTWSAANAQGMKTAMFNNAGTYARFTYTSYGAHTMRILYFGAQTGYSLDFCLGTSTNATASGVTGYRGWAGGTVQFWVGGKLNSTVNHGASAGNGVYNSYIDWGHGGSGSWTFTIHANSPNTGAHPASCIRYYCSRCSHYEDRHEEY
mgnify:CR=1 FL=1